MYRAAAGTYALPAVTEWDEFFELDFEAIYKSMEKPVFTFDGTNIFPHANLQTIGFDVHAIGKAIV